MSLKWQCFGDTLTWWLVNLAYLQVYCLFPPSFQVAQWYRIRDQCRKLGFNPWVGKIPWRSKWQPAPVFLSGKSHGQRSLVGYHPWGCKESDLTEHVCTPVSFLCQMQTSLSYIWKTPLKRFIFR